MDITLTLANILKIVFGVFGVLWILIKYILSSHSKKMDNHIKNYDDFKEKQQKANITCSNYRDKFKNIDKDVVRLIEDSENRVSDRIDRAINPLINSINVLSGNVNIIMQHILNSKNDK